MGQCSIDSTSQLSLLPDNVTSLQLQFTIKGLTLGGGGGAVLPSLPMLQTLTIDMLNIASIQADAFSNLPDLTSLVLINTDIYRPLQKTLAENAFRGLSSLTVLQAPDTGVAHLTPASFSGLSSLCTLDLSHNLLGTLPDGIFMNTNLTSLDLSHNQLSTLTTTTLQGLTHLQTLDLSHNAITALPAGAFTDLISLETLKISQNPLRVLQSSNFQGLLSLTMLYLNDDEMSRIPSGLLTGIPRLESLDLNNNHIISIEDGAFSHLSSLKFLKLYDNPLQALTSATFIGLRSLGFLDLHNTGLVRVEPATFTPMSQLTNLHMDGGNLTYISPGSLQGLQQLRVLTLHDNQLSSLEEGLLSGQDRINHLDLSGNPWHCDCQLAWIHPWMLARRQDFILYHSDTTSCATPHNTTGTQLTDFLDTEYPICVPPTYPPTIASKAILAAYILPPILLVLLVVIMIGFYCRHKKYRYWAPNAEAHSRSTRSTVHYDLSNHGVAMTWQELEGTQIVAPARVTRPGTTLNSTICIT